MPFVSLLLVGCNPMDAQVWGDYAIFLAAESSQNIQQLEADGRDFADPDVRTRHGITDLFDCRDLSYFDTVDAQLDERLPDEGEGNFEGAYNYEANCCVEDFDDDPSNDPDGDPNTSHDCTPLTPEWYAWLDDQSYYVLNGSFEPGGDYSAWRTEGVITAEGDLQLTVHIDFPRIGDLRYDWVIDPDFQPTDCVDGEDGSELIDVDGDWLAGWSAAEESGTIWYLNAGAYQFAPSDYSYWALPQEWMAGDSSARFEDEEFYGHATDYDDAAENDSYPYGYQLYWPSYEDYATKRDATFNWDSDYSTWVADIDETLEANKDLEELGKSDFDVDYKVEDNSWRVPYYEHDASDATGLYNWTGVNVSWVRIDNPEDIEAHNSTPVVGEYQIMLDGVASASKIFIRGSFVLENIREDSWGYSPTLDEYKREENNTPECGDYRLTWDSGEE